MLLEEPEMVTAGLKNGSGQCTNKCTETTSCVMRGMKFVVKEKNDQITNSPFINCITLLKKFNFSKFIIPHLLKQHTNYCLVRAVAMNYLHIQL